MVKQTLCGKWKLYDSDCQEELDMTVPGSVLSTFVEQKKIDHPYERDNEYKARELFRNDYRVYRNFKVDETLLNQDCIELVCYGLDTLAEVYINQKLAFTANNMHRTWRFECKSFLKPDENEISILFKAPITFIENYKPQEGKEISFISTGAMEGNQYIRKAHSMFGWDWGAQLPDAGIWRPIELIGYTYAKIDEVLINQEHLKDCVKLHLETKLHQLKNEKYEVIYTLVGPTGNVEYTTTEVYQEDSRTCIEIHDPKLWWPNGYGEQPLYKLEVCLKKAQEVLETKSFTVGLRTLTISQEKDEWGKEFAFCINGVKIFTRGANYIPEDCIYSWITKERIEYLIKSCVRANYNCLRVWGGGYYPSDEFYELCNQYGLIVWQDLMYACNIYEVTDEFAENIVAEAIDNVRRLRHHPCLGLWCGNNEIESAWDHWGGFQNHSNYLKADYIKQFEYLLPKAVKSEDKTTFYWPSSPSSGGCFNDPDNHNIGDNHYWDVWHGQKPFSDYQKHFFRFCSEFGFQSFPSIKTIETFTIEEDRNIFSKVMESHQKNDAANGKILYYISESFRYPKDFESLLYISQILQGIAVKSGVDHWRRNRGRCMGTLYWQVNDNWPVASWSSIDYYGRWKALHYMAQKFYAPVAGSIAKKENRMGMFLTNERLESRHYTVSITLKTLDFKVLKEDHYEGEIEALSSKEIAEIDYTDWIYGQEDEVFVEAIFRCDGKTMKETEIFVPYKHLKLKQPTLNVEVVEEENAYRIEMATNCLTPFVELDFKNADAIFEENYFTLTSSEVYKVRVEKKDIQIPDDQKEFNVKEQLKICSLKDTY